MSSEVMPVASSHVIDVPVQVGDKVWFIADDELMGGFTFEGNVTELTLTSMKVATINSKGVVDDSWTLPLTWFAEEKAFTTELSLVDFLAKDWMMQALQARRENRKLSEAFSELDREHQKLKNYVTELEYKLGIRSL